MISQSPRTWGSARFFSAEDPPSSEQGDGPAAPEGQAPEAPTAPPAEAVEAASPSNEEPVEQAPDFLAMGYTKRQAAWLNPDPEKHKHFLPRLSRKELGSYNSEGVAEEFAREIEFYPQAPSDRPLYNLREVVPEMMQPRSELFDRMMALQREHPNASPIELAAAAGIAVPPPSPPLPDGVERILEWELRLVMSPGIVGEAHPANKKAKCRVHLRALQRQCGLSDEALRYIAEIAESRYCEKTGVLTLTSERFAERELNRQDIVQMLQGLVEEGRKLDRGEGRADAAAVGET